MPPAPTDPSDPRLQRVVIVGTSCAGKSTLARRLARLCGGAYLEMDQLWWQHDWVTRQEDEFRQLVAGAVSQPRWVADGNYFSVRHLVWSRATLAIWLNYPFWLVFSRALKRTLRRAVRSELLFAGNRETWYRSFLSSHSILLWVLTTHHRRAREFRQTLGQYPWEALPYLEFRHPGEAEGWLRQLESQG